MLLIPALTLISRVAVVVGQNTHPNGTLVNGKPIIYKAFGCGVWLSGCSKSEIYLYPHSYLLETGCGVWGVAEWLSG
ncbi:hypothetical protein [Nostoc sp. DedSLP04]|uniref:hypothetical protein n=1 Tax=Nostoc sp. DedSLP04 TaxID=3075401 RepID=UPI002AD2A2E9|nr:hypothetical protein [Nostoc sp. DedSLP04]MDZ8034057.1 hypothetical protein [Nostoc sp. DedSLP04]